MKTNPTKNTIIFAVLVTGLITGNTFAGTFSDALTSGLNPTYWSIIQTTPGLYSVNATGGGITIAKIVPGNPGAIPYAGVSLNLAALGWSIPGDFSAQIQFANAVIGPGNDQVQLNSAFSNGSIFF